MRGRRRSVRLCITASVCSLALAGSAQAATLTLGSQFQGTIEPTDLAIGGSTIAQTALAAPLVAVAPVDGTVTEWRFAGSGPPFTPQVIRPTGGGQYAVAASGAPQEGAPGYAITGPFPLNLPIRQGDLFGYSLSSLGFGGAITRPTAASIFFTPPLGGSPESPDSAGSGLELAVNATVRYCVVPDLKGKKPAGARSALTAADCTVGTTTKSKKRRKKRRVLSQSVPPGSQISDTAPVDIKVSRKRKP